MVHALLAGTWATRYNIPACNFSQLSCFSDFWQELPSFMGNTNILAAPFNFIALFIVLFGNCCWTPHPPCSIIILYCGPLPVTAVSLTNGRAKQLGYSWPQAYCVENCTCYPCMHTVINYECRPAGCVLSFWVTGTCTLITSLCLFNIDVYFVVCWAIACFMLNMIMQNILHIYNSKVELIQVSFILSMTWLSICRIAMIHLVCLVLGPFSLSLLTWLMYTTAEPGLNYMYLQIYSSRSLTLYSHVMLDDHFFLH